MGHVGHPEFIKTPPLEVAVKTDELKQYYEGKPCFFAGIEGDHWVDIIACQNWPDLPYYVGYYNAFNKLYYKNPTAFAEKLVMLEGTVVDIEDVPALEVGESIVLIHDDLTISTYDRIDDFISVVEALHNDPEMNITFDSLTVLIGKLKGIKWREQLVRQSTRWNESFEKRRTDARNIRIADEFGEVDG